MKTIALAVCCLLAALLAAGQDGRRGNDPSNTAQEFVTQLAGGGYAEAAGKFDPVMTKAMPPEKLRQVWEAISSQAGGFKGQTGVRTETTGRFRLVFVTCEFGKGSLDAKIVFDGEGRITGLWFVPTQSPAMYEPPAYARLDSFSERDVTVGTGEWQLPGTLTMPKANGPFPAVVLVHGSGPHDRDESIGPNKPFRDLAWGLASKGVAVLRYEKRTKAHGAKMDKLPHLTVKEETVDDAAAAARLLRETEGIDAESVFVLGHSLGGMLVPRIAAADPEIAGYVVMAGTTRPLEDAVVEQVGYITSLAGELTEREQAALDDMKAAAARVKALYRGESTDDASPILGASPAYWLDLQGYDPAEAAKGLARPMLILQGGRDYQVTPKDFDRWKEALSSRADVEFKLYPGLNHVFIEGKGASTPSEYERPGHVAERVVDDIARWLRDQT